MNKLNAPNWCPTAIPTAAGWEDPSSGEVLKSAKHSKEQIQNWWGISVVNEVAKPTPIQTLHESPVVETVVPQEYIEVAYAAEEEEEEEE